MDHSSVSASGTDVKTKFRRSALASANLVMGLVVFSALGCVDLSQSNTDLATLADADVGRASAALVVCPTDPTLEGIDVSHWQEEIDWDAVAADGVDFAFIRVSHGTSTFDRQFERNWSEARRVGMIRGVYQFFSAGSDPIAQADLLVDAMGPLEPGVLPPVLDVEDQSLEGQPRATVLANMDIWLDRVMERTGRRPIIYTARYFWQDELGGADYTQYPLWVANYGVTCPNIPVPWSRWDFWQFTDRGSVAGIIGDVDTNIFQGDRAALMALTGPGGCGDGVCDSAESTSGSCPMDCPICAPLGPLGGDIDDSSPCFTEGGDRAFLRQVTDAGWESSLIWTTATDFDTSSSYGVWNLSFEVAGRYRVEAYIDPTYGQSSLASYDIRHGDQESAWIIDQSAADGWTPIAELEFAEGGEQWVRLDDNTGESTELARSLVFDALRLTRLDAPAPDSGVENTDAGSPIESDAGTAENDAGMAESDAGPIHGLGTGCSLGANKKPAPTWLWLLLPALLLRRRRTPL